MCGRRARSLLEAGSKEGGARSSSRCGRYELRATISVGWAAWDGDEDADRLIKRADIPLYEARDSGRNAVRAAETGSASLRRRT
jgi:GGDEF domain-containing protein